MDCIFDIDGTLANAEHRLHFIKDRPRHGPGPIECGLKPDWDSFLSDEQVAKDTPIPQTWEILASLLMANNRIIFITGRPDIQAKITYEWLTDICEVRALAAYEMRVKRMGPILYMRTTGDRRPSHDVKEELLFKARADGFDPKMVFEDRKDDTAMWRRNGLLCCQVAEGDY